MSPAALAVSMVVAGLAPAPWAPDGPSQGEDLEVSLATFGPGDDLPSWWGHGALFVEDRRLNQARLYNYGMFDFSTGFVHKFVQGRLEFWVGEDPVRASFEMYKHLDREVTVQELNLTPAQRLVLAHALAVNVTPEHRDYLYHHYNDNCSTRPRDLIDQALGGQLLVATSVPARMSLREHTRRYSSVNLPMSLVLDYLQNDELDRPITQREEAFLPDELERQLDHLQIAGPDGALVPAVKRKWVYYQSVGMPKTPEVPPNWVPGLLAFGLAVGGAGFGLRRLELKGRRWARVLLGLLNALLGLTWGSLGVFLFIVGLFTNHMVAHHNENLLLINPVTFGALPFGLMYAFGRPRGARALRWVWVMLAGTAALGIVLKVLPWFDQANWNLIAMAAPVSFGLAAAFWRKH